MVGLVAAASWAAARVAAAQAAARVEVEMVGVGWVEAVLVAGLGGEEKAAVEWEEVGMVAA